MTTWLDPGSPGPLRRATASLLALVLLTSTGVVGALAAPAGADESPAPVASLDVPGPVLLGEAFSIAATFDNIAAEAEGYGPYLDVYLPVQGADGEPNPDGVTYDPEVTFLGTPLEVVEHTLACDGASDVHPFTGAVLDCPQGLGAGDVLLVVELPFGSFTASQPPATVDIDLELSELADLDVPLPIHASAGFRYGATPLDDPATDPPIVQAPPVSADVDPELARLSKTYLGPEDETATGPNFPRTWVVELVVAEGQPLTDVVLTDLLPGNVALLDTRATVADDLDAVAIDAPDPEATPTVDGEVVATFPTVTGTGDVSAAFEVDFYVPEHDAHGDPVIDPDAGQPVTSENHVSATGEWDPLDGRDDERTVAIDEPGPDHVLTDRSLAIQKHVSVVGGGDARRARPGDVLEWTLDFQVSDYFAFGDLVIADVLTDGQSIDDTFAPRLTVDDATGAADDVDVTPHVTTSVDDACDAEPLGGIQHDIDLSAAVDEAVDGTDGVLTGGLVAEPDRGPTQGSVTFRTVVDSRYRCLDDGQAVDSLDPIGNDVEIAGDVIRDGQATGHRVDDDSAAGVTIVEPDLEKSIYARNGDTDDTGPRFAAGDTVTYRLTATKPITNVEGVSIVDYLPLPVLAADEIVADDFAEGPSATPPPAGTVGYGPDHTGAPLPDPEVTTDAVGNSVTFDVEDVQTAPGDAPATIDLLLTVTLSDEPRADGLFLTNQARMTFSDSFATAEVRDEIVQLELTNPQPAIHKGVVATDGVGDLVPEPVGPGGPWSLDGDPRFDDDVTSSGLEQTPLDRDLDGAWAGDRVAFAVVVENTGSGLFGAFDTTVADTMPDGMVEPDDGIELQVHDGAGNPLGHDGDLFGAGLVLDNGWDGPGTGGLAPHDPDSGRNLAVVTYVLEVADDAAMSQAATNTATITNLAAVEDGESYPEESGSATVTVADPQVDKTLLSTGQTAPLPAATIGETATYEVVVEIPPSVTDDVVLRDTLDAGLAFVSFDHLDADAGLSSSAGDFPDIVSGLDAGDVSLDGRRVDIDLGTLTNDTDQIQTLTFTSTVVVRNVDANAAGDTRANTVELRTDDTRLGGHARADDLQLVEPSLTVAKSVDPTAADADDTVTYTITVSHPAGADRADAFDVELADVVPDGLTYLDDSFEYQAGLAPDTLGDATELTATWTDFPVGEDATFTFEATVDADAAGEGPTITNTAEVTWTSIDGDTPDSASPFDDDGVQRTGDDGDPGQRNDYRAMGDAEFDVVPTTVDKAFLGGSAVHTTGTDLTIGEVGTFELTVVLPEGELGTVEIVDDIPDGMAYVGESLAVDDGDLEGHLGDAGVDLDPGGGADGDALTVTFDGDAGDGTGPGVTVEPSTGTQEQSTVVLTYDAVVLDVPANVGGDERTNAATVTVAGATSEPAESTVDLVEPDVTIAKSFDPALAAANDEVTITLTVANDGSSDAFDLAVTDVLDPDVLTDVAVDPAELPTGWTGTVDGTEASFTSDDPLVVGESVELTITAVLVDDLHEENDVPGVHTNTATVVGHSLADEDDPEGERRQSGDQGVAELDLVVPDLVTTKTGPTAVEPGQTYEYTIEVENVGERDASGVEIVDAVPDADYLTFEGASDGGVLDPDAGDHGTVTWDVGDLAAGATVEVTVTFTVAATVPVASDGLQLTNHVEAWHDESSGPDPTPEDNEDDHTVTLESLVDVAVAKEADVTSVGTDGDVTYTITATNVGNEDAAGIELADELPDHVTFAAASDGGSETDGVVTWEPFDLPAGQDEASERTFSVTVTVDETVPAGIETLTNTVVATTPGDDNPDNDTDTAEVSLDAAPALDVTKTDDRDDGLVGPGDPLVYTIEVTNTGDQDATGVTVVDTLPDEVAFVDASDDGSHADGVVTWDVGDLAAGASTDVTVEVVVADPVPDGARELVNEVVASDDGTNSDEPATDRDDETTRLNVTELTKALHATSADHTDGTELAVGEVATYELTVTLPEGDVGQVVLTDQIPDGMAYVGDSVRVDADGLAGDLGTAAVALDPDGGSSGQPLTVAFDDVTVDEDDDPDTTTFRVRYDTVVLDAAGNIAGDELTNRASVRVAGRDVPSDEVTVEVVEPTVEIEKQLTFPDAAAGDLPGAAAANDTVAVTLTVTNTSDVDAFDLEAVDPLDGDVVASAAVGSLPDGWDGEMSETDAGPRVTFTGQRLAAGEQAALTFPVVLADDVPVPGSHTNVAGVSWQSLPGGPEQQRTYGPVEDDDRLDFVVPDLRVTKEVDGDLDVEPGDEVAYTITVHNDGGREAAGVVLTDTLPDDTRFLSASDEGTHDAGVVTWAAFDLAAGDHRTVELAVQVDDPVSPGANVLTNTARADDDGTRGDDPTPGDNEDTANVALDAFVDLAVSKSADLDVVAPGGQITYTLTVDSLGNEGAEGIALTDELPDHVTFVAASDGGTESDGVVTWPPFSLDGADGDMHQATFAVTVAVDEAVPAGVDTLDNTATVSHPEDVDDGNDTAREQVTLDAAPDLAVTKTSGQSTTTAGSAMTYDIEVTNVGDQGATGVTIVDTLPVGLAFADASDGGTHDDGAVTWELPDELPAGQTVTVTLDVTVDDPLPAGTTALVNSVVVDDDGTNGPDPSPEDNEATDTVTTGADLSVAKTADAPPVPGATAVYEIVVANAGPETVSELSLVETLPAGLSDPEFTPEAGAYDPTTAVWSGITLSPGDELVMTVTAQVSLTAPDRITNQVEVTPIGPADPDPSNNRDETTDPVVPQVDLVLDKHVLTEDWDTGEVSYGLTVRNDGPSNATGVLLEDTLPAGLSPVTVEGDGWDCRNEDALVRCALVGTLGPGETADVRLDAAVDDDASGVLENVAEVTSNEPDADERTRVDRASVDVPAAPEAEPDPVPDADPDHETDPQPPADAGTPPADLPRTGAELLWLVLLGLGVLGAGSALIRRAASTDFRRSAR